MYLITASYGVVFKLKMDGVSVHGAKVQYTVVCEGIDLGEIEMIFHSCQLL